MEQKTNYAAIIFKECKNLKAGKCKMITCPKCNSKLYIYKAKFNGHITAICENDSCIKIFQ